MNLPEIVSSEPIKKHAVIILYKHDMLHIMCLDVHK